MDKIVGFVMDTIDLKLMLLLEQKLITIFKDNNVNID